ncbi:MAG: GyrI-like domain-containing protein [Thermoplasmata archaeon]|nr:GyrI-like domain-containing protein [Thermoplasmata archaeon]
METFVELPELKLLWMKTDLSPGAPRKAFGVLESKLSTLQGRRFWGVVYVTNGVPEVYCASVERVPTDDPKALGLEEGSVPAGRYVQRKLVDWPSHLHEIPAIFEELVRNHPPEPGRPSLEFYRSQKELRLYLPVPPGSGTP